MSQKGAENILQTQCSLWRCSCVQNTRLKYGLGLDTRQANLTVTTTTQGQFELHKLFVWFGEIFFCIHYINYIYGQADDTHWYMSTLIICCQCNPVNSNALFFFYSVHKYEYNIRLLEHVTFIYPTPVHVSPFESQTNLQWGAIFKKICWTHEGGLMSLLVTVLGACAKMYN